MIDLRLGIENKDFNKAVRFETFRTKCKKFLDKYDKNYDKFSVVEHDSFIGYLTERAIKKYYQKTFPSIKVSTWEDQFDIARIIEIIDKNNPTQEEVLYVEEYFYDKWDLKLVSRGKTVFADVKTALTEKSPQPSWNFMYPVIQANKEGKDIMILVYYVVRNKRDLNSIKNLILIGFTTPNLVRKCKLIPQGSRTRFGTVSQIDNYETELSLHYKELKQI